MEKIRAPIINGIFYPAEKNDLQNKIKELMDKQTNPGGTSLAFISPHAGFQYSGDIAAAAFKSASKRKIKTAVILAPVHRDSEDALFLTESDYFKTPLGNIPVDIDLNNAILECSTRFLKNDIPHLEEHAIEAQLPFVQHLFPDVKILPVLMGNCTLTNVKALSKALEVVFCNKLRETLFIISANLSSYQIPEESDYFSKAFQKLIFEKNWEEIIAAHKSKKIYSCGSGCVAAFLAFAHGKCNASLLKEGNSSHGEGQEKVVHYGAISFDLKAK